MKRRRKQLLLKLGVFLLLGAIVNVAAAWGCAAWLLPQNNQNQLIGFTEREAPCWLLTRASRCGHTLFMMSSIGTHVFYQMFDSRTDVADSSTLRRIPAEQLKVPDGCYQQCFRAYQLIGWPCPALACERSGTLDYANRVAFQSTLVSGIALQLADTSSDYVLRDRALPFRPIWPGFAINTIFYAATLWLLWIAPGKIRRFIRVRGHRCPACGYEIAKGVGPRCSECGAALPWMKEAPT